MATHGHDSPHQPLHEEHHHHHHHHTVPAARVIVADGPCCTPSLTGALWVLCALADLLMLFVMWAGRTGVALNFLRVTLTIGDLAAACVLAYLAFQASAHLNSRTAYRYRQGIIFYAVFTAVNFLAGIGMHFLGNTPPPPSGPYGPSEETVGAILVGGFMFSAIILALIMWGCYSCANTHYNLMRTREVEMNDVAVGQVDLESPPNVVNVVYPPQQMGYPVQAVAYAAAPGVPTGFAPGQPMAYIVQPSPFPAAGVAYPPAGLVATSHLTSGTVESSPTALMAGAPTAAAPSPYPVIEGDFDPRSASSQPDA